MEGRRKIQVLAREALDINASGNSVVVLSTRRASLWRFFVPLQPRRYEVQAPYSVLVRASPWPRRDQGAPGRDQEHRYPWPPGRAKGAAASAHAATGGASAAGAGWASLGADFGAQSARSTGPGFWAGAEARATWR